jgi:hypothetical protein
MALKVKIGADAKSFFREMDRVDKRGATMGQKMKAAGKAAAIGIGAIAAAATAAAVSVGALAMKMVRIGEDANTADDRIRQITGNMVGFGDAAEKLSDRIIKVARAQSMLTAVDNKTIKEGQAKLAIFADVLSTADEAGGVFERATAAMLDLSATGFGGVAESAAKVGALLQDPIRNMNALARARIQFTQAEQDGIRAMVESNNLLGAQNMILGILESRIGGTAEATANGTAKIRNAISLVIEDAAKPMARAFEQISETVLAMGPAITATMDRIAPKIASVSSSIGAAISEMLLGNTDRIVAIGNIIGESLADAIIEGAKGALGEIGNMLFKGNTSARTPTGKLLRGVFGDERVEGARTFMADAMADERGKRIEGVVNRMGEAINAIEREGMMARREALMREAEKHGRFNFDLLSASQGSGDAVSAILREIQTLNRNLAGFPN